MSPVKEKVKQHHCRSITKYKGVRLPKNYLFLDTETETIDEDGTQKMIWACAVYWQVNNKTGVEKTVWIETDSADELYKFILKKGQRNLAIKVMSANIWFDLRVSGLLDDLRADYWTCSRFYTSGHTFIACFKHGAFRLEFINVQNYFNMTVAKIGKSIGLPKLDIDLWSSTLEQKIVYCRRDTEIIFQAFRSLYHMIRDSNLGSIGYTLPSIAFSCYTHTFIPQTITLNDNKEIVGIERSAYYGGRCECFHIGVLPKQTYYKLDVNSMYPYVMKHNEYPTKYHKLGKNMLSKHLIPLFNDYCFIAEVKLCTDEPVYPYRSDNKLIFPVGEFTTFLCTGSLKYAIEHKHVLQLKQVVAYRKANLFSDYVDYFYAQKVKYQDTNNQAFVYLCKILLNSLYGKFGQKKTKLLWETESENEHNFRTLIWHAQQEKYYVHQRFFGLEQMLLEKAEEGTNAMPAIAAHVTDYARMYLWRLIDKIGIKNCYYVDTDSIIVNKKGMRTIAHLLDPGKLGRIKIEEQASNVDIRGAKHYFFGGDRKIKGIPKKAKQLSPNQYEFVHFPSALTELRDGLPKGYKITKQIKKLTGIYNKGTVTKTGRVKPFKL